MEYDETAPLDYKTYEAFKARSEICKNCQKPEGEHYLVHSHLSMVIDNESDYKLIGFPILVCPTMIFKRN